MSTLKHLFFRLFSIMDRNLKFPALKRGSIGIQVGFDMCYPQTSDLFGMSGMVGRKGVVYGIDPDPWNHRVAEEEIRRRGCENIKLIQLATFSERTEAKLLLGRQASWSQLGNIGIDETADFSGEEREVQLDTLDHIFAQHHIDIRQVRHVNITNNGAEYHTLKGFENGLRQAERLALTVVAGRYDASGTIDGRPDHELITSYLQSLGYRTRFRRIHQLFWWGFCVKLLINRTWVYNRENYGVIFAVKGSKSIPFFQSFS
jgi:FkbM family methyltransferase